MSPTMNPCQWVMSSPKSPSFISRAWPSSVLARRVGACRFSKFHIDPLTYAADDGQTKGGESERAKGRIEPRGSGYINPDLVVVILFVCVATLPQRYIGNDFLNEPCTFIRKPTGLWGRTPGRLHVPSPPSHCVHVRNSSTQLVPRVLWI